MAAVEEGGNETSVGENWWSVRLVQGVGGEDD